MEGHERYCDGCSDCGWTGEFQKEDKCPECGREGTMLRCRDYELDCDVTSAAYRYDAFNDGIEWAWAHPDGESAEEPRVPTEEENGG